MNSKTHKIIKWTLITLLIIALNSATIFFFFTHFIEVQGKMRIENIPDVNGNMVEVAIANKYSWWESITNKNAAKDVWQGAWQDYYHIYNESLTYFFMLLGVLATYVVIKCIIKGKLENKKFERLAENINRKQNLSPEEKAEKKAMKKIKKTFK